MSWSMTTRRKEARQWRPYELVLLLLLFSTCGFVSLALLFLPAMGDSWLSATLHSLLFADYRADLNRLMIPPPAFSLIGDLIHDNNRGGAPDLYATLITELLTPVPTVTTRPGQTPFKFPTFTATSTQPLPTNTPTATLTPTPSPTWTPLVSATITPTPTVTPTYYETQVPDPTRRRPTRTPTQPASTKPLPTKPPPPTSTPKPYPPPYP